MAAQRRLTGSLPAEPESKARYDLHIHGGPAHRFSVSPAVMSLQYHQLAQLDHAPSDSPSKGWVCLYKIRPVNDDLAVPGQYIEHRTRLQGLGYEHLDGE